MGVWWMEGDTEQSRENRMIPRLTTGAICCGDCEAAEGKIRSRRNQEEFGDILFGVPV